MSTVVKHFGDLEVGDTVVRIETTTFTEPHTVTRVARHDGRTVVAYADGGRFWPLPPSRIVEVMA